MLLILKQKNNMWELKKIHLINFGPYKNVIYDFLADQTCLVQGENVDSFDQESNGSGKSFLLEGVAYSLLGQFLKNIRDIDMIRDYTDEATLSLFLINSRLKQDLIIERKLFKKSSSKLKIFLNGEDQKDKFSSIGTGNDLILGYIGINKKDLLNYFILSKKRAISFYYSSDTEKKDIIGRFSGAYLIKGIDKLIDMKTSTLRATQTTYTLKLQSLSGKIEVYKENIEEQKKRDVKAEKAALIKGIDDQILANNKTIDSHNQTILNLEKTSSKNTPLIKQKEKDIQAIEKEIEGIDKAINDYETAITNQSIKITKLEEVIRENKIKIGEFEKFALEVEKSLVSVVKCPNCEHEFSISDEELDIEEARKVLPEVGKEIKELTDAQTINEKLIKDFTLIKNHAKEEIVSHSKFKKEKENSISLLKKDKLKLENDITLNGNLINSYKEQIQFLTTTNSSLEQSKKDVKVDSIKDAIAAIETKIAETEEEVIDLTKLSEDLDKEIFEIEQWKYNFIMFTSYLANESLSQISGLANEFMQKAKMDLSLVLDGFTVLANKEIRERIDATIIRNGIEEGPFDKYSEGEKARIEVATILALQHLININCETGGLNFLGIDEVLESVDKKGIENICFNLNNLEKTILIITHASHDKTFPNLVTVRKENGEAKILN